MLKIENLHASVVDKPILKGLSLTINAGEIHAIMGPNGAGKSTTGYVLGGRPGYEVTGGSVEFLGQVLLALAPHERAAAGLFLGFQYPVEIPGVSNLQFLREALNSQRKFHDLPPLSGGEFIKLAKEKAALLKMDMDMLKRPVNVGFSGGEKKRAEMVQMGILDPKLAILDETDSGLDIDALRICGEGINAIMRKPDKAVLLITHDLNLVRRFAERVLVMAQGELVEQGPTPAVFAQPRQAYTQRLITSRPEPDPLPLPPLAPGAQPRLQARGLRVGYPVRLPGLRDWFKRGEFVAVLGADVALPPGRTRPPSRCCMTAAHTGAAPLMPDTSCIGLPSKLPTHTPTV